LSSHLQLNLMFGDCDCTECALLLEFVEVDERLFQGVAVDGGEAAAPLQKGVADSRDPRERRQVDRSEALAAVEKKSKGARSAPAARELDPRPSTRISEVLSKGDPRAPMLEKIKTRREKAA
jgi:hypothetical protein